MDLKITTQGITKKIKIIYLSINETTSNTNSVMTIRQFVSSQTPSADDPI